MYPKRILISVISPAFDLMNRYSAVASVIYSFADLLRNNGHEIYVNELKLEEWEKKVFTDKNATSTIVQSKMHRLFPSRIRELVKDLLLFRSNKKLFKRISCIPKPDLVLSWVTYGNSYGIDLAKKWNIPIVAIFDNPLSEEYNYLKGFAPFFKKIVDKEEKRSVQEVNSVIVYSHAVKEHLERKYQLKANFHFKAFTDFKRMKYSGSEKDISVINFAYIGSFFNWHKIEDLIEAFNRVNDKYPNCRLFLIGDGPEFPKIKADVKNSNIILTGKLDGSELDEILQKIHVGVISNALWFHAPVKLFQYSANELAVISRKTPTILELISDNSSYSLFENSSELLQRMIYFMEKPEQIEIKGREAKEYVKENYSEEKYLNFLKEIFRSI